VKDPFKDNPYAFLIWRWFKEESRNTKEYLLVLGSGFSKNWSLDPIPTGLCCGGL